MAHRMTLQHLTSLSHVHGFAELDAPPSKRPNLLSNESINVWDRTPLNLDFILAWGLPLAPAFYRVIPPQEHATCSATNSSVPPSRRLMCERGGPFTGNVTYQRHNCERAGCCFDPVETPGEHPWCFLPSIPRMSEMKPELEGYTIGRYIEDHMGYRLAVSTATLPSAPLPRGTRSFNLTMSVLNWGFSIPQNRRPLHVVLMKRGSSFGDAIVADQIAPGVDVRKWQPRHPADPFAEPIVHTFSATVSTESLGTGDYELGVWLPDERAPLNGTASAAIRFANEETDLPWRVWGDDGSQGGVNVVGKVSLKTDEPLSAVPNLRTAAPAAGAVAEEYTHFGGGLTSVVMSSIISKLPPVTPPKDGVRGDSLMRTVRLTGAYRGDVPMILPSFTRLVLNGSITALPYALGWTEGSAGEPNETASLVSVKDGVMVSVEGGSWTCADWNSTAAEGNTSTVTAIYFDNTSYSFIRNLNVTSCGQYSGGETSASIGIGRKGYNSGNIRIATPWTSEKTPGCSFAVPGSCDGGGSNVVENVESSYSWNRGIWVQSQKLVVSSGSYHHNDADGIDLDGGSSYVTIHDADFYMNARCGVFLEFSASLNTIVGNRFWSNHISGVGTGTGHTATQHHNVILSNVLGPADYPAGCPEDKRPCPSYCPVNDTCQDTVGLPCGTCHYLDQKDYSVQGIQFSGSHDLIAVLNDLGGSSSSGGSRVANALVALNYNGSVDNSGSGPNTSTFSFNPEANDAVKEPRLKIDDLAISESAAVVLYVDNDKGRDTNSGHAISAPLKTLEAARDALRQLTAEARAGGTVEIRAGDYSFAAGAFELDGRDSGVTWRACADEAVRLHAGRDVTSLFEPVQQSDPRWSLLPQPHATKKLELAQTGLHEVGPVTGHESLDTCWAADQDKSPPIPWLYADSEPMLLARYPNTLQNSTWAFMQVTAPRNCSAGSSPDCFSVEPGSGEYAPSTSQLERWAAEVRSATSHELWLHGYWGFDCKIAMLSRFVCSPSR